MEKTGRLFMALWVATFGLVAVASFAPDARLWGINHLAFYPLPFRLVILGLIAASAVPVVADAILRSAQRFVVFATARHRAVATAISLGCFALFIALPSATMLLGDGYFVATNARERAAQDTSAFLASLRHLHPVFQGTELLYALAGRIAARLFGIDAATVIRILAVLIGQQLVFALAVWLLRPRPRAQPADRLGALMLAASGGMVFFYGYVEVYTPFLGVLALYAITAHRALCGKGPFWKPAACVAAAIALHLMGLVLLPSLAWLALLAAKGRTALPRLSRVSRWACVAMVPLPWLLRLVPRFKGLVRPLGGEPGAALGPVHLADAANLLLLVCPAMAVLACIVLWNRLDSRSRKGAAPTATAGPEGAFAALIAVPLFLFLLAFRSDLGVARDWDLFVPAGLACLALVHVGLRRLPASTISARSAVSLVVLCAAMTGAWVGVNASAERSVARYRAILTYDAAQITDLGYAYEQLATYHMHRNDIHAEVDALEHAVQVSRNPRYRFTLGMCYYQLGQKERAIDLVQQSLRSAPNDARIRQTLVQMLYVTGRTDEILRVCDEGIRIDASNPFYHFFRGRVLASSGSKGEALDALRRARSLSPPKEIGPEIDALIRSLEESP